MRYSLRRLAEIVGSLVGENDDQNRQKLREFVRMGLMAYNAMVYPANLIKEGAFRTVAPYTTGKAQFENGSKTVVALGSPPAVFTSSMVGRQIIRDGDTFSYEIAAFSGGDLTLDRAYMGTTTPAGGSNYIIAQDRYRMAGDMNHPILVRNPFQGLPEFDYVPTKSFVSEFPYFNTTGVPKGYTFIGVKEEDVTGGTINAASKDAVAIAGTSTTFAALTDEQTAKVQAQDYFSSGNNFCMIGSVTDNTNLTLLDPLEEAISAGASYKIKTLRPILRFDVAPSTSEWVTYPYYASVPSAGLDSDVIPLGKNQALPLIYYLLSMFYYSHNMKDRGDIFDRKYEKALLAAHADEFGSVVEAKQKLKFGQSVDPNLLAAVGIHNFDLRGVGAEGL